MIYFFYKVFKTIFRICEVELPIDIARRYLSCRKEIKDKYQWDGKTHEVFIVYITAHWLLWVPRVFMARCCSNGVLEKYLSFCGYSSDMHNHKNFCSQWRSIWYTPLCWWCMSLFDAIVYVVSEYNKKE